VGGMAMSNLKYPFSLKRLRYPLTNDNQIFARFTRVDEQNGEGKNVIEIVGAGSEFIDIHTRKTIDPEHNVIHVECIRDMAISWAVSVWNDNFATYDPPIRPYVGESYDHV